MIFFPGGVEGGKELSGSSIWLFHHKMTKVLLSSAMHNTSYNARLTFEVSWWIIPVFMAALPASSGPIITRTVSRTWRCCRNIISFDNGDISKHEHHHQTQTHRRKCHSWHATPSPFTRIQL